MARCLICNTCQNRFRRGAVNQDEIPVLKMIGDHIGQYSLIGTDGVYQLIGKIEPRWNKLQVGATQPRVADKNVVYVQRPRCTLFRVAGRKPLNISTTDGSLSFKNRL